MRKALVLSITLIATAAIIAMVAIQPQIASAQAPPQPPPDTTTAACCRVLATSARTVAGPGAVKAATWRVDAIFESSRRTAICATAENTGTMKITLIVFEEFIRVPGGFSAGSGDTTQAVIEPGQTSAVCRQDATGAVITFAAPGASYMWRVDSAD